MFDVSELPDVPELPSIVLETLDVLDPLVPELSLETDGGDGGDGGDPPEHLFPFGTLPSGIFVQLDPPVHVPPRFSQMLLVIPMLKKSLQSPLVQQ